MKKRILSIVLIALMLVALFPSNVFAGTSGKVVDNLLTLKVKYSSKYTETYYYHIPQIVFDDSTKDTALNEKIYEIYEKMYLDGKEAANDNDPMTDVDKGYVGYACGHDEMTLSIAVKDWYAMYDGGESIKSYHMNIATGKEMTHEEVVATFGYSWQDFLDVAETVLPIYFYNKNKSNMGSSDYDFAANITSDRENIKKAQPFINSKGELCIIGIVGSLAGSGKGVEIVNINTLKAESTITLPTNKYSPYAFESIFDFMITLKHGDVNGDGDVNALDATQILRYANGKSSVFSTATGDDLVAIMDVGDVNRDGAINALDATQILRYANGKTSFFDQIA